MLEVAVHSQVLLALELSMAYVALPYLISDLSFVLSSNHLFDVLVMVCRGDQLLYVAIVQQLLQLGVLEHQVWLALAVGAHFLQSCKLL